MVRRLRRRIFDVVTEPIRILRVIARMNVGGPALQVSGLQRQLDPTEFDSRLVVGTLDVGEADYLQLRAPDVAVTRLPGLGRSIRPTDDIRALGQLVTEIRRFRPAILHTHTAKAGMLGRVAATFCRVPYTVHTFHGHVLEGYFSPRVSRGVARVEGVLARRTTRLVAVGSQVREDLLSAGVGSRSQFLVVPPGVSLPGAPSRNDARSRLGLPAEGFVVGFTARLTAVKRPDRMVEVVRRVLAHRRDVTFVVAGEGPDLGFMRAAAEEIGGRLRLLGWRSDVEAVHAACDVALLTSDNEGMPVSLIEAGLCGTPAVASDVGSVREVVIDGVTGRVVRADAEALSDALLQLLGDPQRLRAMGAAAESHTSANFSLDRLVADMENLYRTLVGRP